MWKRRQISSLSGLFYRNPAAVTGVVLAPLVVVCTSLQTAAALSLVFLVLSVPVQLAAGLGGRYLPKPLWLPAMLVLSAVLLYPAYYWVKGISPTIFDALGLYMPLMAVTPVLTRERFCLSVRRGILWSLVNALSGAAGFALAAFLAGGIREYLGNGSLWGNSLSQLKISGVLLPFFGFILVGFLAAIAKGLVILVRSARAGGRLRPMAAGGAAAMTEEPSAFPAADQADAAEAPCASNPADGEKAVPAETEVTAAFTDGAEPSPSSPPALKPQQRKNAPAPKRRTQRPKPDTVRTAASQESGQQRSGAWSAPSYGPVPRQPEKSAENAGSSDAGESGAEK